MPNKSPALTRNELLAVYGSSGTQHYNGYYSEELNPVWRDAQRVELVEEMRRGDGTIKGILNAIKTPMLATSYRVQPASEDARDIEIAEEVEHQLFQMDNRSWRDLLREILTYLDFGHSAFEKIYALKNGKIYLKDLSPRIQNSIQAWQLRDGTPGIRQLIRNDEERDKWGHEAEIPMAKLVIFTNDKEGDDITGQSILRSAYSHWKMKFGTYRVQSVGIERTTVGIPTGRMPAGINADEKAAFEDVLKNLRANEMQYVLLPDGYEFEFTTPSGNPMGSSVKDFIDHHNRMILLSVLAEFLDLGSGNTGSFALSKDQSSFMLEKVEEHLNYVVDTINRCVVKEIVDLNYTGVKEYPTIEFDSLGTIDYAEMSQSLLNLVNASLVDPSDPQVKVWIRKLFGMPEIKEEDIEEKPIPEQEPEEQEPEEEELKGCDCWQGLAEKKKSLFWRPLTELEQKVDYEYLAEQTDSIQSELESALVDTLKTDLATGIRRAGIIAKTGNLNGLRDYSFVTESKLTRVIKDAVNKAYEVGKKTASKEIKSTRPATTTKETQQINYTAEQKATEIKNDIEKSAKSSISTGIIAGIAGATIIANVSDTIKDSAATKIMQTVTEVVGDYIGKGRQSVFEKNSAEISGYIRTEALDSKTCETCLSLDGRIIKSDDPYRMLAKVHNDCRGEWIALKTEDMTTPFYDKVKKITTTPEELVKSGVIGIPKSVDNAFKKVGGVPVMNKFTNLKKPINKSNAGVQDEWKKRTE